MFSRHVKRFSNSTPSTPTFLRSHHPVDRLWLDHHRSKTELLALAELKKIESRIVSRNGFIFENVCKRIELYRSLYYIE